MRKGIENLIYVATGYIEERGVSPLKDIHEKLGGFPVVNGEAWKENSWNLENVLKLIRDNGYSTDYLIDFSVDTDLKNSSRSLINASKLNLKKIKYVIFLKIIRLIKLILVSTSSFS